MRKEATKRGFLLGLLVGLVMLIGASPAMSYTYGDYVGATDWVGSLDQTGMVLGNWTGDDLTLGWNITKDASGLYTYSYTFTTTGSPGLSHLIIEVTDYKDVDAYPDLGGGVLDWYSSDNGNPGMPVGIDGVKFDTGDVGTYTAIFTSYNAPVWGNFYAKGGNDGAYNIDFSQDGNFLIARPNGAPVPIPGAVWLLGSGLSALLVARRRRKRN